MEETKEPEGRRYTFWKLIKEYKIEIPTIQRDYAQGRNDSKATVIRDGILDSLYGAVYNALLDQNSTPLDMDFVYGSLEKDGKTIFPLDGQQRLTTLFLLHWYLAYKDNCADEAREVLKNFTYKTRFSSADFCEALVENGIDFSKLNGLNVDPSSNEMSSFIIDSSWFFRSWKNDPTILSILNMLDSVNVKFHNLDGGFAVFKREVDQNPPVTFLFLELKKFGLSDDLYVRMNARGKPLTEFENFKAKFTDLLKNGLEKGIYQDQSIRTNFSKKIDNDWTDLFWMVTNRSTPLPEASSLIDPFFMRYLTFITEILYVRTSKKNADPELWIGEADPHLNYAIIEEVYSSEENIQFLFKSLDFWHSIWVQYNNNSSYDDKPCSRWLKTLFAEEYSHGKVVLFDFQAGDLWTRCITGKRFDRYEKTLLYAITLRGIKTEDTLSANYAELVRVVRNLLETVRRVEYYGRTGYERESINIQNLRNQLESVSRLVNAEDISAFLMSLEAPTQALTGFGKFRWEVDKAWFLANYPQWREQVHRLEDHPDLRGVLIHLLGYLEYLAKEFPDPTANAIDPAEDFTAIWTLQKELNPLIVQAFLTVGNDSVDQYGHSVYAWDTWIGPKRYFGSPGKWNRILTTSEDDDNSPIANLLRAFLEKYRQGTGTAQERLQKMVKDWLEVADRQNPPRKGWRYYFIKYPEMVSWKNDDPLTENVFAWKSQYQYEMRLMLKTKLSTHTNPYLHAIMIKLNNETLCHPNGCWNVYGEESHWAMRLAMGFTLRCLNQGIQVTFPKGHTLKSWQNQMIDNGRLKQVDPQKPDSYWLGEPNKPGELDREDRIENAVNFILDLGQAMA